MFHRLRKFSQSSRPAELPAPSDGRAPAAWAGYVGESHHRPLVIALRDQRSRCPANLASRGGMALERGPRAEATMASWSPLARPHSQEREHRRSKDGFELHTSYSDKASRKGPLATPVPDGFYAENSTEAVAIASDSHANVRNFTHRGSLQVRVERPTWPFSVATCRRVRREKFHGPNGSGPATGARWAGRPPQRAGGSFPPAF